jgi:O-succinylbenzoic acid--CoA ligase
MNAAAWLRDAASRRPDRVAVEAPDGAIRYAELHARASAAAPPSDLSAVAGLDFVVALHSALAHGAPAVPLDPRLAARERSARVEAATGLRAGADTALVLFTSGTTAAPRPVALTYDNLLRSALGSAVALGLDPAERWLCALPLAHIGGLSVVVRSAIYGTTAVLHDGFDAERVREALGRDRITLVSLVPTMLARLLDAGLETAPSLRAILLGGGPATADLLERARERGLPVAQTYGLTEACSQVTTSTPDEPDTAGWPLPGTQVRLGDDEEILVRGPTVAPAAAARDGWLRTGDLGRIDDRGRLTVTGRLADTIVSGGENVAPSEVEAVLVAHPSVADAAVHARPDPEWGEAVVATVVLARGEHAGEGELRDHCRAHLAPFKVPKAIAFADSLPRTSSGKLLRREL